MSNAPTPSTLEARLTRKNSFFNPELDFLRAAAVLMVVIDHTGLALQRPSLFGLSVGWLGLIGVWIFFVHTTLVLMWSLERKPYTLDFYIRRIFRIYPLAILAIVVATVARLPLTGSTDNFFQYHAITRLNFATAILLVFNLAPPHLQLHPIVNVVGTLPLEVDMYLLLPGLFAFASRCNSRWPLILLWAFSCCIVRSLDLSASTSFLSTIPCFLSGLVAYVGYRLVQPALSAKLLPPFLLLIVIAILLRPSVARGWLFSLLIGWGLPYFKPFRPSWFTTASHHIAKYSYGIYLSHPFGLVLGIYFLPGRPIALQLGVELLTILIISVAGYHLFEEPMIRLGAKLAAKLEVRSVSRDDLTAPSNLRSAPRSTPAKEPPLPERLPDPSHRHTA